MLQTTWSVWLPDRGWGAGHHGKDGGNCLWSLVSWVACRRHHLLWNAVSLLKALWTCSQSCVHCLVCSHQWTVSLHCNHGGTAYIISDCNWRWQVAWTCVCSVHYRTTHMHSTDSAVARCLSVRLSVTRRYSVYTVIHILIVFSSSGSFSIPNGIAIFRREPP